MDGVLHNHEKVEVIHNIDERLKNGELIDFAGSKYTLSDINQIMPVSESRISLLIEWDDMCQYMCVGLVSVINKLLKQNRVLNLMDLFKRKDYPYGLDYIKYVFYKGIINPDIIDEIYTKYYLDIMQRSPITLFFDRINLLKPMVDNISFVFSRAFSYMDEFVSDINLNKFNNTINCNYHVSYNDENTIDKILKINNSTLLIVADMGLYYKLLLDTKKKDKTIVSYINHNGVNSYILAMYANVFMKEDARPINGIRLDFLNEIKEEETKEEKEYELDDIDKAFLMS